MYRFLDLNDAYWTFPDGTESPLCAILNTCDDTFLKNHDGSCVLHDLEEVREAGGDRAVSLVPKGFFERSSAIVNNGAETTTGPAEQP